MSDHRIYVTSRDDNSTASDEVVEFSRADDVRAIDQFEKTMKEGYPSTAVAALYRHWGVPGEPTTGGWEFVASWDGTRLKLASR